MSATLKVPPEIEVTLRDESRILALAGEWTAPNGARADAETNKALEQVQGGERCVLDMTSVTRLDTLGALVIVRMLQGLEQRGCTLRTAGLSQPHKLLLDEVSGHPPPRHERRRSAGLQDFLADIGEGVTASGRDMAEGVAFLGSFVLACGRAALKPARFRWAALFKQVELVAFRSVPIIVLISFLVGAIIAQQSVFQLRTFGTTAFVADLLGILVLRELGLLLTAIMIAGRSGSAMTAELGSMKMREEIDALRTMGLDAMEVLVVPRVLGLIIGLPLLTFIASIAALTGGGLVAWFYGDVSPEVFLSRLRNAIGFNTFMVGMIKAPFMALVIGMIATIEGLSASGSAESLGRQTTASVVKSIFMVIVVDGLFAMFFAAIRY
jgi:phospholipid/cholesterol/gamma-HCH transport system permease protein